MRKPPAAAGSTAPSGGRLYGDAPLSIAPEVGALLYAVVLASGALTMVEFGASYGYSTIHLAAARRDLGSGHLITTELVPERAQVAAENLTRAGLADLVELRVDDALETLCDLGAGVELLFLDGWNDLYLPVLELLQPSLATGALVVADLSRDDPHLARYRARVCGPDARYVSIELPLDEGVVISRLAT
ncbi:MAG: class I SAM-dependent methyltransferase [Solirubrobacterales bacterium]|nr:class I SAM-dependent methyltransferase [Solirubrobacterales bacterium]MBV9472346.1 class I SAM-dependent methyltransferase [Solirubrobacterales bacterium]MBV9837948.1 class I SAM-dependent methyltransferase [Solirubrobacterales bacterium]